MSMSRELERLVQEEIYDIILMLSFLFVLNAWGRRTFMLRDDMVLSENFTARYCLRDYCGFIDNLVKRGVSGKGYPSCSYEE